MFFIFATGRRSTRETAETLDELGKKVMKAMANKANDGITVAIGKTDQSVMPYAMLRRSYETDKWEGDAGDSIRLGIDEGLLIEHDPLEMLNLEQAVEAGIVSVEDDGPLRVVSFNDNPTPAPKRKKLSNEEKLDESRRMIDDLFDQLHNED
jgi:hypothetical protein